MKTELDGKLYDTKTSFKVFSQKTKYSPGTEVKTLYYNPYEREFFFVSNYKKKKGGKGEIIILPVKYKFVKQWIKSQNPLFDPEIWIENW